jgi:hypothetical protein
MRADFWGLFSPGAAKPWARTFPEPRESNSYVSTLVLLNLLFLLAKTMPNNQKFQPIWLSMIF